MMEEQDVVISVTEPMGFVTEAEVAGVWCFFKKRFLLLKRHPEKPQGDMWGIPAGKLGKGEEPLAGAVREVTEEIGVRLQPSQVKSVGSYFVEHPDLMFIFHIFFYQFKEEPKILLEEDEHTESRWVTREEAFKLPLIGGGEGLIHHVLDAYESVVEDVL